MDNQLRQMLTAGKKAIGTFVTSSSSDIVEALGYSGFDYVIFDNEHAPMEAETTGRMILAAERTGLCPLVRIREISRPAVMKLLDVGARGLIVPNVKTIGQVRELISYAKYPPIGERGFGVTRVNGWGYAEPADVQKNMEYMNESILILPQCETVEAVQILDSILETDGVDGIFIGPFDLSVSMGIPGEFSLPLFRDTLQKIVDVCHRHKKICMKFASTEEMAVHDFEMGADAVTYQTEQGILIDAGRERLSDIRKSIE